MAFMMPVVKNDWDIYHSQRTRRTSESTPEGRSGRARKISESRSEGPALSPRCLTPGVGMGSPHRSAPTIRSASYCRPAAGAPPSRASRASLRPAQPDGKAASGSPPQRGGGAVDKFHTRTQSLRAGPAQTQPARGELALRRRLSAELRPRTRPACTPPHPELRRPAPGS